MSADIDQRHRSLQAGSAAKAVVSRSASLPRTHRHADHLTRMANQIAAFCSAYPEPEAIDGVGDPLMQF